MTDLARCQKEARIALAAWIETGDLGALMGWADWMIEQDYIALEVRDVAVCELPSDDLPGGTVPGVPEEARHRGAKGETSEGEGANSPALLQVRMRRGA